MAYERKGEPHPSGRPIHKSSKVGRSIWRIPDSEPNVPRLRQRDLKPAVGFVHDFSRENGYEDE
jgi:hypothetical protein